MKESFRKLCTKIVWYISALWWKLAIEYYETIRVPDMNTIVKHYLSTRNGLCILGFDARDFKETINNRLKMIIYWAAKQREISLSKGFADKKCFDICDEINKSEKLSIRKNEKNCFVLEYSFDGNSWKSPIFVLGNIWKLDVEEETKLLLYLANILITAQE